MQKRLYKIEIVKEHAEEGNLLAAEMKIAADDIDAALVKAKEIVTKKGYLLVSKIEQVATIEVT